MKYLIAGSALLALVGCDTALAHMKSLGQNAHIKCFSGGTLIYEGDSRGKLMNAAQSDGYEFMDNKTGKLIQVSGQCVVTYP